MYPTLVDCEGDFELVCVDAGSSDGSLEYWKDKCYVITEGDVKRLSVALNVGADYLIEKGHEYVLHIHNDMEFEQKDWINVMVEYLKREPDIAKLAADWDHLRLGDREGNQCPWMMRSTLIKMVKEQDGYYFDPEFRGIGGSEDWDLNCRLIRRGYRVTITSDAIVKHEGMGTRSRMDTNQDALYNRHYYVKKWGTHQSPV
jgi:GT2 family glycosyltransferase